MGQKFCRNHSISLRFRDKRFFAHYFATNNKISITHLWHAIEPQTIIIIMYLYSAQYLHILHDLKRYLTNPTVQVQPQLTSN